MQRLFVGGSNYGNVYAAILLGFWGTRLWKSYRILAMTFVIWGPGSVHKCLRPSILRRGSGFFILVPHQTIQSRHLLSPHHSKNSIQSMSTQNYYHDSKLSNTIDPPEEQSSKTQFPVHRRSLLTLLKIWRWEIFTWILSTLALISMISLLISFNGLERSKWKAKFELSTIIAALSQLV